MFPRGLRTIVRHFLSLLLLLFWVVAACAATGGTNQAGDTTHDSAATATRHFTVKAGEPNAPNIGLATAGDGSATVSFTPPSGGARGIISYTATSTPGNVTATASRAPIVVSGLTNGQPYTFTVTATNNVGTGPASAASNSVTPKERQIITFDDPGSQDFGTSPQLTATTSSGLPVSYSSRSTPVCTITPAGVLSFVSAGTCTIVAFQQGDTTRGPAPSVTRSFTVNAVAPGAPTIGTATAGGGGAARVSFTPPASNGGAAITRYKVTSSPDRITATGTASPITVTGLDSSKTYNFTVTATNSAGTGPASAASNNVRPIAGQTISFPKPGPQQFGTSPTLTATASSGLEVSFTSATPSVCEITPDGHLSFLSAGTCTINADQAGNASYTPAPTVSWGFIVNAVRPDAPTIGTATAGNRAATVSFTPPLRRGGAPIIVYTVTSAPDGITATGAASPITVTGLDNTKTYSFTVTATNSAGTSPASAASNSVRPIADQTISFPKPGPQKFGTSPTLTATASSHLPVSFTSTTPSICTITPDGHLSFLSAGTCKIDADQPGNASFTPAPTVSRGFIVNAVRPDAPTIGNVVAGNASASVSFTAPVSAGGAPILLYVVTSIPDSITASGTASPVRVAGLNNGTTYRFTVKAVNRVGAGAASAPSSPVRPIGVAPMVNPVSATVDYDSSANYIALSISGTYTRVAVATPPSHGTARVKGTRINYTPAAGYSGPDDFTYTATGNGATSSPATVTITVNPQAPVANDVSTTVSFDSNANVIPLKLRGGAAASVALASQPAHGTAIASGTRITYTPDPDYSGSDSFTYTATNAGGTSAPGTINITVTPHAPVARNVMTTVASGSHDNPIILDIVGTEITSVAVATAPTHGTAVASGTRITYTPAPGYVGSDSFTYTATNAGGTSLPATATITINPPAPVANAVSATVVSGSGANPIPLNLAGGPATSVAVASSPSHGTADANGTNISYTPAPGYIGNDSFTYTATNAGGTSAPGTISITVGPQLPIVGAVTATVAYDSKDDPITLNLSGGAATSVAVVSAASHGSAKASGTSITYTPATGYSGSDSFTYTATNATGSSRSVATVTITVSPQLPIAGAVSMNVVINSKSNVVPLDISGGTADSVAVVAKPAHGTAATNGLSILYTPQAGFAGSDSFTYTASNEGGSSAPATVSITVNLRPDPSQDQEVIGVLNGQVNIAKRFALTQMSNVQTHMESLHRRREVQTSEAEKVGVVVPGSQQTSFLGTDSARTDNGEAPSRLPNRGTSVAQQTTDVDGLLPVSESIDPFAAPTKHTLGASQLPWQTLNLAGSNENFLGTGLRVWSAGTFNLGHQGLGESRFTSSGISVGTDRRFRETLFVGVSIGLGHSRERVGDHGSRNTGNNYAVSAYLSYQPAVGLFFDGLVGYGRLTFDSNRYASAVNDLARSNRKGAQLFSSLTGGYEFGNAKNILSPYVRMDLVSTRLDATTENGDALYTLRYQEQTIATTKLSLGLRGQGSFNLSRSVATPYFRVEYQHDFEKPGVAEMNYADDPSRVYRLEMTGTDRNAMVFGLGSDFLFRQNWSLGVRYQYTLGTGSSRTHGLGASIRKPF